MSKIVPQRYNKKICHCQSTSIFVSLRRKNIWKSQKKSVSLHHETTTHPYVANSRLHQIRSVTRLFSKLLLRGSFSSSQPLDPAQSRLMWSTLPNRVHQTTASLHRSSDCPHLRVPGRTIEHLSSSLYRLKQIVCLARQKSAQIRRALSNSSIR